MRILAWIRENKVRIIVLFGVLILSLCFISSMNERSGEEAPPEDFYRYTRLLQENLEEMLSSVNGVGKCRVLITFSDSGETVYACDEDSLSTEEKTDLSRKYVLISSRSEGLVLKVYSPSVLGVAVICRGGDSTRVKNDVTEVLSRTLGIPADRISVKKMSS